MAAYNKINDFAKDICEGVHTLSTTGDTLILALSNTAPASETSNPVNDGNGVLANVTQIAYTNLSSRTLTINAATALSSGTFDLVLDDITLSATGTVAGFRYVYVYNDTPTSPADPLICYFDYGSTLVLNNGESLTVDFESDGPSTGSLFTLA